MIPDLAAVAGLVAGDVGAIALDRLHGDGSQRTFYRVRVGDRRLVLLCGPDPAENAAYVRVAKHLGARGVRVPAVCGVDEGRGWVLMEDLGDRSLFGAVREAESEDAAVTLYGPVLDLLVTMQVKGAEGFDLSVGFAPSRYDREVMIGSEGLYFAEEFAGGLLGLSASRGFREDLEFLADEASRAPGGYFLHRDFQSRNIHLTPEGPSVIDFQGARPGPLGYDAAALILDPYVRLSSTARGRLFAGYLESLRERAGVDAAAVEGSWWSLGAFRLLQALGAFGKLGGRLGKPGFLEHAGNALGLLGAHLGARGRRECPALWELAVRCEALWRERESRTRTGEGGPEPGVRRRD